MAEPTPAKPLQFVTVEADGYCDAEDGACHLPGTQQESTEPRTEDVLPSVTPQADA